MHIGCPTDPGHFQPNIAHIVVVITYPIRNTMQRSVAPSTMHTIVLFAMLVSFATVTLARECQVGDVVCFCEV